MVVKKEETAAENPTELLQRIETLLQRIETEKNPPAPCLTEEIRAALSAPLDPKFLKQRKGSGGKTFTYADLDYLESRASAVDPDWSNNIFVSPNSVVCTVTIHSVTHADVAGYYIPEEEEVWDSNKNQMVTRRMTPEKAHSIVTKAKAAAERRAFAMFGLGAELWSKNTETAEDFLPNTNTEESPRANFRAPSEARISLLVDLGVPERVGKRINSWSTGKGADGKPISDVGNVINALFKARGQSKGPVERPVWEKAIKQHAPYALSDSRDLDDYEDEDDDF